MVPLMYQDRLYLPRNVSRFPWWVGRYRPPIRFYDAQKPPLNKNKTPSRPPPSRAQNRIPSLFAWLKMHLCRQAKYEHASTGCSEKSCRNEATQTGRRKGRVLPLFSRVSARKWCAPRICQPHCTCSTFVFDAFWSRRALTQTSTSAAARRGLFLRFRRKP